MDLSKLSLGTAQFGFHYGINSRSQVNSQDIGPILALAKSLGITHIDTSPSYGDAEKILGRHSLSDFKIITKTLPKQLSIDSVHLAFFRSLEELQVQKVYGLLIHQVTDKNITDQVEMLKTLKARGLVEKIGVSVYSPTELKVMLRRFTPDIVSIPVNVFDQRFSEEYGLIQDLKRKGVEVHSRSVFLQGVVYMDPLRLPAHLDPLRDRLLTLTPQLAMEYVKKQCLTFVDHVTLGVDSLAQLIQLTSQWRYDLKAYVNFTKYKEDNTLILNPALWPVVKGS